MRDKRLWALGVVALGCALLSGCVTVETNVQASGKVTRQVIIEAPERHAEATRAEARRVLGNRWRLQERREGAKRLYIFTRRFNAYDKGSGMSVTFTNDPFVLPPVATYTYRETIDLSDFFATVREQENAKKTPIVYRVSMPGTILEEGSNATRYEQRSGLFNVRSVAEWQSDLSQVKELKVVSRSRRNLWALFWLVFFSAGGYSLVRIALLVRAWLVRRAAQAQAAPTPA